MIKYYINGEKIQKSLPKPEFVQENITIRRELMK